jgi:Zn-dependent M16 (insulinase) family peptidase
VIDIVEAADRRSAEIEAYNVESFWVAYLNFLRADLVNQNSGGLGSIDPSCEARKKMSDAARGNRRCVGRKLSEETKKKIAAAARCPTEEQRRKMSEAAKKRTGKRNSFFGHKHSTETKEKISRNNGSRKV